MNRVSSIRTFSVVSRRFFSFNTVGFSPRHVNRVVSLQRFVLGIRTYHSSPILCKKVSKGKGKKGDDDEDDDAPAELPDLKSVEKSMDNTLNWATLEIGKIKVGRVTADLFANLPVESYGTVGKAGQVTLKSSSKLVVALFDPAIGPAVAEAIRNCGLGINPQVEGNNVLANIPKPSKEARDMMLKNVTRIADKAKMDFRNFRKNAIDAVKGVKGKFSDDDIKRHTKQVEAVNRVLFPTYLLFLTRLIS